MPEWTYEYKRKSCTAKIVIDNVLWFQKGKNEREARNICCSRYLLGQYVMKSLEEANKKKRKIAEVKAGPSGVICLNMKTGKHCGKNREDEKKMVTKASHQNL